MSRDFAGHDPLVSQDKIARAEGMKIIHSTAELANIAGPVHLAMGVFDGLHCGHCAVIGKAVDGAAEEGGSAGVLTFNPHPAAVLAPGREPKSIYSRQQRNGYLAAMGLKFLLEIPFDERRAAQSARDFICELRCYCNPLTRISVGEDFVFGYGRQGNLSMLRKLGEEFGFIVEAVPMVERGGERVSSTRLRAAIAQGDFETCSLLLGRTYSLFGTVVEGRRLAGEWGFPTANIALAQKQLPPYGVYAVIVETSGVQYTGVANLGIRPTVDEERKAPVLEVHLFDFDENIYGQDVEVVFYTRLREEKRFSDIEQLRGQIEKDAAAARRYFEEHNDPAVDEVL